MSLVVVAALALLGVATPGARLPAVTLGNLLGGYALLALLTATAAGAGKEPYQRAASAPLRALTLAVLALVFVQAALGGSIGAQYALPACPTLGKCPGFAFDEFRMTAALDPWRPLTIVARVEPPTDAAGVYVIHRTLGLVVPIVGLVIAHAWRRWDRRFAWTLRVLAVATPLAGIGAIAAIPSLWLTVLHNACAALLVAALAAAPRR